MADHGSLVPAVAEGQGCLVSAVSVVPE